MQSQPWLRALTTWAAQYFPGEPLIVSAGHAECVWAIARTADPTARERPIIVTRLPDEVEAMRVVTEAHRSPHPIVALFDGSRWEVSLVRWKGPGHAELGTVIQLPRPSAATGRQVDAILRGARKPKRPKKKKK